MLISEEKKEGKHTSEPDEQEAAKVSEITLQLSWVYIYSIENWMCLYNNRPNDNFSTFRL